MKSKMLDEYNKNLAIEKEEKMKQLRYQETLRQEAEEKRLIREQKR